MINERYFCLDDLPNERWKDIIGYEGLYQVSTYSRVKSLNCKHQQIEKILLQKISKQGYYIITLSKNNNLKYYRVNRLVAETFIPDKSNFKSMPDENRDEIDLDKLEINHKDENKLNNRVDNLEWCTHKYNCNYGTRVERIKNKQEIKINQYSLDGTYLRTWNSLSKIKVILNYNIGHISDVCNNKRRSAHGYLWKKYDENINNIQPYNPKTLNQYTRELMNNE